MPTINARKQLQSYIASGQLGKALELLKKLLPEEQNSLILLEARNNRINQNVRDGVISFDNAQVTINRIVAGVNSFVGEVDANLEIEMAEADEVTEEWVTPGKHAKVYFSYAWGDDEDEKGIKREQVVDKLYDSLKSDNIEVIRDKMSLEYGGLISEFMKETGQGDLVVVFISDKYVRSPYCMYELFEIARNSRWEKSEFAKRVLPVRVESLKLDDPMVLDEYFEHWEQEKDKWEAFMRKRMDAVTQAQSTRYHNTKEIQRQFGRLADWLADINSSSLKLLSENDFHLVKEAIVKRTK